MRKIALLTAISVGLAFASSCFPLLATTVSSLGAWSLAAIAASGLLAWLVSRAYAELAGIYPTAAGVRTYVAQAFGDRRGLWLALLYLFLVVSLGASEAFILSRVIHSVFPGLAPLPVCLGFVALCALANVCGIELAGKLQAFFTYGMISSLAVVAVAVLGGPPSVDRAALTGLTPLVAGVSGAMFLFVGFEWVVSAVEEVDPRGLALPRAMSVSVGVLAAIYLLVAFALWKGLAPAELASGVTQHLVLGSRLGRAGLYVTAALSTAATITCFNGGILGASRLCYALAREGVLPRRLATLSPRFLTPWVAILVMSGITGASAVALSTTEAVKVPILVGAAIECAVYAAVVLACARLRRKAPEKARPYKAPYGQRGAVALAVVFSGLSLACVLGAGEWTAAVATVLGIAVTATGVLAWRRPQASLSPRSGGRVGVGGSPAREVAHA